MTGKMKLNKTDFDEILDYLEEEAKSNSQYEEKQLLLALSKWRQQDLINHTYEIQEWLRCNGFLLKKIILQANEYIFFVRYKIVRAITHDLIGTTQEEHYFVDNGSIYRVYNGIKTLIKIHEGEDE